MSKGTAAKKMSKAEKKAQITISVSGDVGLSGASKRKNMAMHVSNRAGEKVNALKSDGESGNVSNENIQQINDVSQNISDGMTENSGFGKKRNSTKAV